MIISIVIKYIIISIAICLLYGIDVLTILIMKRIYKKSFKGSYLFQFWSLIFFIIVWKLNPSNIYFLEIHYLWNFKNIILILICVLPTSIIAFRGKKYKPNRLFKIENFLNGASMEIPQRLLVQNLFIVLGVNTVIYGQITLSILLNALIWVQFIIVQEVMNGNRISSKIISESIASFWFSIWVGIIYVNTGNIIVAMLTHGLQRIVTYWIRQKFGSLEIEKIDL